MTKEFNEKVFRVFMLKAYFDKGFGFLSMAKYGVILLGFDRILARDPRMMIFIMVGYALLCMAIGLLMYHFKVGKTKLIEYENEVNNRFNLFQKEIRKYVKKKTFK